MKDSINEEIVSIRTVVGFAIIVMFMTIFLLTYCYLKVLPSSEQQHTLKASDSKGYSPPIIDEDALDLSKLN